MYFKHNREFGLKVYSWICLTIGLSDSDHRVSRCKACTSHKKTPSFTKQLHVIVYTSSVSISTARLWIILVSQDFLGQFISSATQSFPLPFSGGRKEITPNGWKRGKRQNERKGDHNNSNLSSLPFYVFFLRFLEGVTVSCSCAPLLLYSPHYFREVSLIALHPSSSFNCQLW